MYLLRSSRGALRAPVEVRDQRHAAESAAEAAAAAAAAAPAAAAFESELKEFDPKQNFFRGAKRRPGNLLKQLFTGFIVTQLGVDANPSLSGRRDLCLGVETQRLP